MDSLDSTMSLSVTCAGTCNIRVAIEGGGGGGGVKAKIS